jgi:hypothetical protein
MKKNRRRKCRHCRALFRPDPRNRRHQRYCSKPACRCASKAASQRRWLGKATNRDYFRGVTHVERVRRWRAVHPGYWRAGAARRRALQDDSLAQATEREGKTGSLIDTPLQELSSSQPLVLLGLIAHLTGTALQEDIAHTTRGLRQLAQDILGGRAPGAPEYRRSP